MRGSELGASKPNPMEDQLTSPNKHLYVGSLVLTAALILTGIRTASARPAVQSDDGGFTRAEPGRLDRLPATHEIAQFAKNPLLIDNPHFRTTAADSRSSLTALAAMPVNSSGVSAAPPAAEAVPDGSGDKPLTRAQLMGLVAGGVPSKRVATLVTERGIAFPPTPEFLTDLKSAGAADELLKAVGAARRGAASQIHEDVHKLGVLPADLSAPPDQLRHWQESEQQYRAAEVARPQDPSVHFALGGVLAQEGKWSEAAAQYAAVTGSQPSDAAAHHNLALALRKSGDLDGAIREYRRALAIDPALAAVHDNLGVALSQKGDVDGALAEFREAVRQDPRNAQAHNNLGTMLEQQKDAEGAIREYRQALSLGGSGDIQYNLATAFELKGNLDDAIGAFRQALADHPNDARTRLAFGGALERKGDLAGALEQYAVALKLAPQDPAVRANYERLAKASSAQGGRGSGG